MRVIAGRYGSRPLRSLRGMDIRPTSDRLRETLFDVLTAGNPSALKGTVWIDLYAGTGAVGIEALSRGAGMVYFVESSRNATQLVHENLRSLHIDSGYEILGKDAIRALRMLEKRGVAADYVFLDPPYRMTNEYETALETLGNDGPVHSGAAVIAEHQSKAQLPEEAGGLRRYRTLVQGDAALSFYRMMG